jgi:hypothetical protein
MMLDEGALCGNKWITDVGAMAPLAYGIGQALSATASQSGYQT